MVSVDFLEWTYDLLHELRHGWQDLAKGNLANGSLYKTYLSDKTYREWEAHSYTAGLSDNRPLPKAMQAINANTFDGYTTAKDVLLSNYYTIDKSLTVDYFPR